MNTLPEMSKEPIYNIRSVVERTGIPAETIRAWERRYGFPDPYRAPNGYRLYSEDEIAALNWLKLQTSSGMSIGQAVQLLGALRDRGEKPFEIPTGSDFPPGPDEDPEKLKSALYDSLVSLNEEYAAEVLNRAFARLPVPVVLLDIISPTLVKIGQGWHDGVIPVAIEHFSTQVCRAHIIHAMENNHYNGQKGRIIAACAPGEWHEIGILMLTFLLRDGGWGVTYLGANLSLERFSEVLVALKPHLVLFSATSPESAANLIELINVLEGAEPPKPLIGLGGQAFLTDPTLANQIPGTFFGPRADDAVRQIEGILAAQIDN